MQTPFFCRIVDKSNWMAGHWFSCVSGCRRSRPGPSWWRATNLPAPGVIAQEIVEDLQAALEQFKLIAADMTESAME